MEGVLEIKFHDYKARNSFTLESYQQFGMLVDLAQFDSSVRVIFVHGGKFFSSGAKLTDERSLLTGESFYNYSTALNQYAIA